MKKNIEEYTDQELETYKQLVKEQMQEDLLCLLEGSRRSTVRIP